MGVPGGDVTAIGFYAPADQDKLYALISGARVELANGVVVPATASGRPHAIGKLLKMKTLMAYYSKHRLASPQAGKYTTRAYVPGTRRLGWHCDAKNWRRLHAELWPGVPVPDHEH